MIQISRTVRLTLRALFAAQFNAALIDACGQVGIATPPVGINFEGRDDEPANYFEIQMARHDLVQLFAPAFNPCVLALYTIRTENLHDQMPAVFAGPVDFVCEVHWKFLSKEDAKQSQDVMDALESTFISIMDAADVPGAYFARGMLTETTPVERAEDGSGYFQTFLLTGKCEVHI